MGTFLLPRLLAACRVPRLVWLGGLCLAPGAIGCPHASTAMEAPVEEGHDLDAEAPPVPLDAAALEQIAEARRESIRRLGTLLPGAPPGPLRCEVLLKLGALSLEEGDWLRSVEGPESRDARRNYQRAVESWREVAGAPVGEKVHEARVGLGVALFRLGQLDEGRAVLTAFTRDFPDSPWAPEAWFALGEQAFEAGEVTQAASAYGRAAAYPSWDRRAFALYKQAWCHWDRGQAELGLIAMQEALLAAKKPLLAEVESDLLRFYADAGLREDGAVWLTANGRADLASRLAAMP